MRHALVFFAALMLAALVAACDTPDRPDVPDVQPPVEVPEPLPALPR